jgi:hypothetical protein
MSTNRKSLAFVILLALPFILTYALSRYRAGQSKTYERVVMLLWMVFGQSFGFIGLSNYLSPYDAWRWPRTVLDWGYTVFILGTGLGGAGMGFGIVYVKAMEWGDCVRTF